MNEIMYTKFWSWSVAEELTNIGKTLAAEAYIVLEINSQLW